MGWTVTDLNAAAFCRQTMWFHFYSKCVVQWHLLDLQVFYDVLNLRWFWNCPFRCMKVQRWHFPVDSSFLFLFKRLCVGVWQSIIAGKYSIEYFSNAHNFSTIVINMCCPKYYFQNDKWLLNMEHKTSLNNVFLEEKRQKWLLPAFNLHPWISEIVQNTEWEMRVGQFDLLANAGCSSSWCFLSIACYLPRVCHSRLMIQFGKEAVLQLEGRVLIGPALGGFVH